MTDAMDTRRGPGKRERLRDCWPVPLPDWLPTVLPAGWDEVPVGPGLARDYGRIYQKYGTVGVILSCAIYDDGRRWLHVSVSRKNGEVPTWTLMSEVKDLFVGTDRTAYQVMPPRAKHVNIHEGCLHLWCCIDLDNILPDFTGGGDTI